MDLEKIKQYNKDYYEKNKMKRREKTNCELCGRCVCMEYLKKHQTKSICERKKTKN